MALVWSINERASHGCPRISESQNNQNQLSLPPIILVSYKHTRLAQNTFEREGCQKKRNRSGGYNQLCQQMALRSASQNQRERGGENKIGKVEKEQRVSCGASGHKMFLQLPSTVKSSLNYPKSQVPLHHNPICPSLPIIKQFFPKNRLLPSVLRLPSINPKVFFRQPSSEQSQRKAGWPPWDFRLFSQMANLFNLTHECLGQKKSLEGVLHKCQLGCPSSETSSVGT